MLVINTAIVGAMILCPPILIALSERQTRRRRVTWALLSLLPTASAVMAMAFGPYNPHGDVGPFIVWFVALIGPWIVLLAFKLVLTRPS